VFLTYVFPSFPDKDKWIMIERTRWAQAFNVPMSEAGPPNFPPLTLNLMRALCALSVQENGQALLVKSLEKLWHGLWVNHAEVEKPAVFGPILKETVGGAVADKGMAPSLVFSSVPFHPGIHR
jgi:2-hydroxychromene-2-carboxylate isomerase